MRLLSKLWFDVGIVRYTTWLTYQRTPSELWFDVGIVRYTTTGYHITTDMCCGLM